MPHPLEQKLVALRSRSRRMMLVYGLCVAAATLLAAIVALGAIDYLLQFQDRGLRIIASLSLFSLLVWTAYRFLRPVLFGRLQNADLARQVERSFPSLHDRLVSAVEFLHQSEDDPAAGSAALRRAVIAQTTAESQEMQFTDVVDPRPAKRAALTLAAVCLTAAIFVVLWPSTSWIAIARLANPLGDASWPRATHLDVRKSVKRIARGQSFQVEVIDAQGARLPADVRIHYRLADAGGGTVEETEPLRFADGTLTARRENVQRPFAYRIAGGDDHFMPWKKVEVVEPPAVDSVAVRLIPPAYTGWPPQSSERHIRCLAGTQLQISGKATKPLASANLCFEGGRNVPVRLGGDRREFSVESVAEKSGVYWFELTDRDGFQNGGGDDRWEIQAVPDAAPTVRIERPAGNLYVTPKAVAPVRVAVKDDLAVRDVSLAFRRAENGPESSLPLYAGPAKAAANPSGEVRTVDYRWNLAPLELKPGEQVTFCARASDYLPQVGRSDPRRLVVVTPDEMQERIADRDKIVVAELERALKLQRGCREQADSLRVRLAETRRIEPSDIDRLQTAEHAQRDVEELLTSRGEGVPMHLAALLADLENNGLDNSDSRRRVTTLLEELDRLGRDVLPPIGRELIALVKTSQVEREGQGRGDVAGAIKSLAGIAERQNEVIASLEEQIGRLARWDSYRRFQREIGLLLHTQEEVTRQTVETGRRTLARELRDLPLQDVADLKVAAGRQLELARRLDRALQEAERTVAELRQTDPLAADMVADAFDEARRLAVSERMRTAGGQIEQNQIGQAAVAQEQIAQNLQEILDILANRGRNEVERLVKKLREVETGLNALEQRQSELKKQFDAAAADKNIDSQHRESRRLAELQRQLRVETERLARRLERLQAERVAKTVGTAATKMDEADHSAVQGDCGEASQQAEEARFALADARRQLAEQIRKAAAELAAEQVARLEDAIKHLRRQQENALEESRRLRGLEESQGRLTRSQAFSVQELARLQRSLEADAARLAEHFHGGIGAFQIVLTDAADAMRQAVELLDRRQVAKPTQEAQERAVRQLDMVVESLAAEKPNAKNNAADEGGNDGGAGAGNQGGQGGGPSLAELKLLKFMQQEINRRTEALQQAAAGKSSTKLTEDQRREYADLSKQQGRLAEIVRTSLQEMPQDEDANPMATVEREMEELKLRLGRADSGPVTRQLEHQVVDQLDRLIEQAKKSGGKSQPGKCNSPGSARDSVNPPGQKPGSPSGKTPSDKPASTNSPRPPSDGSSRRPDAAETQSRIKKLWGALPEHVRERMLQSPSEDFPPKYELQIEDYFRRLSEEKREK